MTIQSLVEIKNVFICMESGDAIAIFSNRKGFPKNLDHIAEFLHTHDFVEVMTFEEYKDYLNSLS